VTQLYGYTVEYEQFLSQVTQYVPDVSEFVAIDAIRNAAIEFCTKSLYWQTDLAPIPVEANKGTYQLITPGDTKIVQLISSYFDENLLIPQSPDRLANIYRMGDWQTMQGSPQYITQIIKPEVILVPTPVVTNGQTLNIRVALAPTRESQEIDSEIYEQWAETIAMGARARLYAQPKMPYYDKQAATDATKLFRYDINRARIAVNKGLTRTSSQVEYQRFV
jgi:hypothetical protein